MRIPLDHILAPHGLVHVSCIGEGTSCQPPTDVRALLPRTPGGWIESATYTPPEPLQSLSLGFKVPEPPADRENSLIYLFPAAENAQMSTILQPVLQWGWNGCFGGECWTIASWHCTPAGRTVYSKEQHEVQSGELLRASLKMTHMSDTYANWSVEIEPEGDASRCAKLVVEKLEDLMLFVVGGALEAYGPVEDIPKLTKDRKHFPTGSTSFTGIELHDLHGRRFEAPWFLRWPDEDGFRVVADTSSEVTLLY